MCAIKQKLKVLYAMHIWLRRHLHFVLIILSHMLIQDIEECHEIQLSLTEMKLKNMRGCFPFLSMGVEHLARKNFDILLRMNIMQLARIFY